MATNIEAKNPFSGSYRITQKFGAKFRYMGRWATHKGTDFACPNGTPITAVAAGTVSRVQRLGFGYGKNVKINHYGWFSHYAHLSRIIVGRGQRVNARQIIGYSGRTGYCRGVTGYHLHFGIMINNAWVDPVPYLTGQKSAPASQAEATPKGAVYYTVRRGDSLWKISAKFYGSGLKYGRIFEANRDQIKNPRLIHPGQRLRIP